MLTPTAAQIKDTAALKTRKGRDEAGHILVEGRHPVEEALAAGLAPISLWYREGEDAPHLDLHATLCYRVDEAGMGRISSTDSAPPCVGVFERPAVRTLPGSARRVLLLDGLQDPGNLGTLIRSAVAFGVDAVVLTENSVEIFSPKVIRASAGLVFALPVMAWNNNGIRKAFGGDWQRLVTRTGEAVPAYQEIDYSRPTVLVLGNEGHGISEDLFGDLPIQPVTIPMAARVESLNVAISGSIIMAYAAGAHTP